MGQEPLKYEFQFYGTNNNRRWIRIFSTAEGDCVACDTFRENPSQFPCHKDWRVLPEQSDNYRLLRGERNTVEQVEESYLNIRSFQHWTNQIEARTTSESDTKDSGRDTKEATSSSSYDATFDENWVELRDTTSHDSGMDLEDILLEPTNLTGPNNIYAAQPECRCKYFDRQQKIKLSSSPSWCIQTY